MSTTPWFVKYLEKYEYPFEEGYGDSDKMHAVYEFETEEQLKRFLDEVGGAHHPLGGLRAIIEDDPDKDPDAFDMDDEAEEEINRFDVVYTRGWNEEPIGFDLDDPDYNELKAQYDRGIKDRQDSERKNESAEKIVDRLLEDEPTVASLSDDDIKRALTWLDLDAESGGFFAGDIDISDEYKGVNRTELIADLAARAPNDEPVSEQTTLAELSETYGTDLMQVLLGSRKTMGTPERHQSAKKDIDILDKKRRRAE